MLKRALASLVAQTLPKESYEVLVVDNASTDSTPLVVEEWANRCKGIRYLYEPTLGLSSARNRGLSESRAPIAAFLDDDATASPRWLEALAKGFRRTPSTVANGGPIELEWEGGEKPKWMSRHLMHALGYLDYGAEVCEVPHINGGNMAVDRHSVTEYGGFKLHLGRKGNGLVGGEESDLMSWLRQRGKAICYEPQAKVKHYIPKQRQSARYLLRVYYGLGRSEALRQGRGSAACRLWRTSRELPSRIKTAKKNSRPLGTSARFMIALCELALTIGFVLQKTRIELWRVSP
jgi:glycosyltransferase involved in cell wall biosynthesis